MRVHLEEFIWARRQWFIYDHPRHTHTSIGIWEMKSWIALVHLMLWGTCALLCSTVFVACHRWINHMSDKASKGQALFTIILKYPQICLKRRKNVISRAGMKLPIPTFLKASLHWAYVNVLPNQQSPLLILLYKIWKPYEWNWKFVAQTLFI